MDQAKHDAVQAMWQECLDSNDWSSFSRSMVIESEWDNLSSELQSDYSGYNAWIISSVEKFNRFIGLSPSKKIVLFNGGLECRFMKFEMYRGTRRKD